MTDDFLTQGIQADRYLKSIRLINRFETELRRELERVGDAIVAENQDLFVDGVEADWKHSRSSGTIIAFARVDYLMDRVSSKDTSMQNLKLNISFRWLEPTEVGHTDVEGALSVASYKIKRASSEAHREVKDATREDDWSEIEFADDAFNNSPGIFYIPVETSEELRQAHETLAEHFSTYARKYGEPK